MPYHIIIIYRDSGCHNAGKIAAAETQPHASDIVKSGNGARDIVVVSLRDGYALDLFVVERHVVGLMLLADECYLAHVNYIGAVAADHARAGQTLLDRGGAAAEHIYRELVVVLVMHLYIVVLRFEVVERVDRDGKAQRAVVVV